MICLPSCIYAQNDMYEISFEPFCRIDSLIVNEMVYSKANNVFVLKGDEGDAVINDKGDCIYKGYIDENKYKTLNIPFLAGNIITGLFQEETRLSNLMVERAEYKLLTNNDFAAYCIVLDSVFKERTPNGHIGKIDNEGFVHLFAFLCGEASGLCCSNEDLWYLYKSQNNDKTGYIRRYNLENGIKTQTVKVNVSDPKGLVYINGFLYTYSNKDHYLYIFDTSSYD